MSPNLALVLGILFAIIGTICVYVLILPENKRPTLNKFFQFLHDVFSFKSLLIEKILQALYIFTTLGCIFSGFWLLFSGQRDWYGDFHSTALIGLLFIVAGPIIARLAFESLMMFILLVKNTIAINNKLKAAPLNKSEDDADENPIIEPIPEPEPEPEPQPRMRFCPICGTRYDANKGGCPNGCNPEE